MKAGIPMTRPIDDHQQGVPLRAQHDLPRRPDDPGGRRRHRRRRRHGVDDERAVHPPGLTCGLPHGQQRAASTRSSTTVCGARSTRAHGRRHREVRPHRRNISREPRTTWRRRATSAPPRPSRTGASPTRSSLWRSRSARVTRSSSTPTRACVPAPRSSRSARSSPRSTRTATSPPATRRRSPTAAAR